MTSPGDYGFNKGLETKKDISQSMWCKNGEYTIIFNVSRPRTIRLSLHSNTHSLVPKHKPEGMAKDAYHNPIPDTDNFRVGKPSFNIQPAEEKWFPHTRAASQTALHVAEDERGGG